MGEAEKEQYSPHHPSLHFFQFESEALKLKLSFVI